MRWRSEIGELWDSYGSDSEEFLDGGDCVVVLTHEYARGKGSGVEVEQRPALLVRLSGERVSEIRLCRDWGRALRDAGLTE